MCSLASTFDLLTKAQACIYSLLRITVAFVRGKNDGSFPLSSVVRYNTQLFPFPLSEVVNGTKIANRTVPLFCYPSDGVPSTAKGTKRVHWRFLIMDNKNLSTNCFWSVQHGRVILTGHCSYSWSQKYIICIQALPVKFLIRWSDIRFFWAHTSEVHAPKPCQITPDYWTKLKKNDCFPC